MSLWQRLWPPRPRHIGRLPELLGTSRDELVALAGRVEPLELLYDPVSGEPAVAIEYLAAPPNSVVGVAGALTALARAFQVTCQQATDFVLAEGPHRALVRVAPGSDVAAVHRDLTGRFGVGLHTERRLVRPGDHIRVIGRRLGGPAASPMRDEPYLATIVADRFWAG